MPQMKLEIFSYPDGLWIIKLRHPREHLSPAYITHWHTSAEVDRYVWQTKLVYPDIEVERMTRVLQDQDGETHYISEPIIDYVIANMLERGEDAYQVSPYEVECWDKDQYVRTISFTEVKDAQVSA